MDTSRTNALAGFAEPTRKPAPGNVSEDLADLPGADTPGKQSPDPRANLAIKASALLVAAAGLAIIGLAAEDRLPAARDSAAPGADSAAAKTTQLAGSWLAPNRHDDDPQPVSAQAGVAYRAPIPPHECHCPCTVSSTPSAESRQGATLPNAARTLTADGKVILNAAGAAELERLPGVGSKRAQQILELRSQLRRFRKPTELLRIKGIGVKSLRKMLPHLVLDPPLEPSSVPTTPSASANPQPAPTAQNG